MSSYICATCAVQQSPSEAPPTRCPICEDERQYVPLAGQGWTTLEEPRKEGHRIELRELEPGLVGIGVTPALGIGQRALLVRTANGNLLWDRVGYIDDAAIRARGGISGIGFSHPHFYGAMVEPSRACGGAPIYIPAADRDWVQRDDPAIVTWRGSRALTRRHARPVLWPLRGQRGAASGQRRAGPGRFWSATPSPSCPQSAS